MANPGKWLFQDSAKTNPSQCVRPFPPLPPQHTHTLMGLANQFLPSFLSWLASAGLERVSQEGLSWSLSHL